MTTAASQSIKGKIQTFRTQDNGYSHTRYTRFGIRESTGWHGTSLHTWQRSWTYERITRAKETRNNLSLYPVFILLPTSITDWDIESGRTSRYQLMALGIRHLLDRVPLTGQGANWKPPKANPLPAMFDRVKHQASFRVLLSYSCK